MLGCMLNVYMILWGVVQLDKNSAAVRGRTGIEVVVAASKPEASGMLKITQVFTQHDVEDESLLAQIECH